MQPTWGHSGATPPEAQYAKKITRSLQRLRATLEGNVSAASNAVTLLHQDGSTIRETLDTHKYELKTTLVSTSLRLSRVKNAEWREKVAVLGALILFTSTVAYIIAKRTRILTIMVFSLQGLYRCQHMGRDLYARSTTVVVTDSISSSDAVTEITPGLQKGTETHHPTPSWIPLEGEAFVEVIVDV